MKERPILFSGEMVRAILNGTKTQTRRIFKSKFEHMASCHDRDSLPVFFSDAYGCKDCGAGHWDDSVKCPYGKPGDRLWVRETWSSHAEEDHLAPRNCNKSIRFYEVEHGKQRGSNPRVGKKRPSILMPRWHCRIFLEIASVRVERLQDITEEDAKAEGVSQLFDEKTKMSRPECNFDSWTNYLWHGNWGQCGMGNKKSDAWQYQYSGYEKARDSFSSLWESINGPGSWEANPWVWVIEFKRVKP